MLKKYSFFVLILIMAAISFGCSDSDDEQNSQDISVKVFEAVNQARIIAKNLKTKGTSDISNPPYWTGTYTYPDNTSSYPQTYTYEFTWLGYSYGGVTLSNGSTTITWTMSSANSWVYSYTGSFNVIHNGESYDYSWDITASYNGSSGQYSYSGTYTLNGEVYNFTYSGSVSK